MRLTAEHIEAGYGQHRVLRDVSLTIAHGEMLAIIGPNGSGKSTLLKVLGRLLKSTSGVVALDGQPVRAMPPRQVAQAIAMVSQQQTAPPGLTVAELVAYGRHPHLAMFQRPGAKDRACVEDVIERCRLQPLRHRMVNTLSGGEQQRTWIAMALAQQPSILLLDEPVSALDINHQLELLTLLEQLNQQQGLSVAMVLHDINLAARYCSRLIAMKQGAIFADGPVNEITAPDVVGDLFNVQVHRAQNPIDASWLCHFELFQSTDR